MYCKVSIRNYYDAHIAKPVTVSLDRAAAVADLGENWGVSLPSPTCPVSQEQLPPLLKGIAMGELGITIAIDDDIYQPPLPQDKAEVEEECDEDLKLVPRLTARMSNMLRLSPHVTEGVEVGPKPPCTNPHRRTLSTLSSAEGELDSPKRSLSSLLYFGIPLPIPRKSQDSDMLQSPTMRFGPALFVFPARRSSRAAADAGRGVQIV